MTTYIEQFPITGGPLMTVPTCDGPEFASYHLAVTQTTIPIVTPDVAKPNMGWFPVFAVRVEDKALSVLAANKSPIWVNSELTRMAVMLTRMVNVDAAVNPPDVQYQVRVSLGCTPEVVAQGTIHIKDFGQIGLIAQVGGYIGTQYEFWARVPSTQVAPARVALGLDVIVDRFNGFPLNNEQRTSWPRRRRPRRGPPLRSGAWRKRSLRRAARSTRSAASSVTSDVGPG